MIEIIMPTGKYIIDCSAPIELSSSPSKLGLGVVPLRHLHVPRSKCYVSVVPKSHQKWSSALALALVLLRALRKNGMVSWKMEDAGNV